MNNTLTNNGVLVIGDADLAKTNATVVVGTARGGTSMVAGAVVKLGINMGDQATSPVLEDIKLSESFEKNNLADALSIVQEYSKAHKQWGWKRPSSIDRLFEVEQVFGAPRYIFIYKDILSIANRNLISMLTDLLPGMHHERGHRRLPRGTQRRVLAGEWPRRINLAVAFNDIDFCLRVKHAMDQALGIQTYFADPYCSWQRGSNENFNGLLRQYIPKKRRMETVTDEELTMIENILNHRPRKRLGFKTPHDVFHVSLNRVAPRT